MRLKQEQHRNGPVGRLSLAKRAVSPRLRQERPDLAYLYRLIGKLNPPRRADFLAPIPGYRGSSAERLSALGIPIMFLVGQEDTVVPPDIIRMAHEQVPGSEYEVIPRAGHSAYFEQADDFNDQTMRFLERAGWT
jgi:pimeloyl-ACP methyl ester carboxylesterase